MKDFPDCLEYVDRRVLGRALRAGLHLYRWTLGLLFRGSCRFEPSCSHYSEQAIEKYGGVKGLWMTFRRLIRCQPFHPGGFDPVP